MTCIHTYIPAYLQGNIPAYLHAYSTYLHAYIHTYIHTVGRGVKEREIAKLYKNQHLSVSLSRLAREDNTMMCEHVFVHVGKGGGGVTHQDESCAVCVESEGREEGRVTGPAYTKGGSDV